MHYKHREKCCWEQWAIVPTEKTSHQGRTEGQHKNQSPPIKDTRVSKTWAHSGSYMTPCSVEQGKSWNWSINPEIFMDRHWVQACRELWQLSQITFLACSNPWREDSRNEPPGKVQRHDEFFHTSSTRVSVKADLCTLEDVGLHQLRKDPPVPADTTGDKDLSGCTLQSDSSYARFFPRT